MSRVALLLSLVPVIALSAQGDWVQVHKGVSGDAIYIDRSSVKKEGEVVRYTEKMVFATPRPFGDVRLKTLIGSYSVRCAERTSASLGGESITDKGQRILAAPPSAVTYRPVASSSPDALTFNFVCKSN